MKFFRLIFPGRELTILNSIMPRRLYLFDIGARGGIQPPWTFLEKRQLSLTLVEPDPAEADELQRALDSNHVTVLPFALWKEEAVVSLNINRSPGTSSLYAANKSFLDQFPDARRYDVISRRQISTVTIDSLISNGSLEHLDFLKIDVQGAELAILEGGRNSLRKNLAGLEVEVEFAELYKDQPLFSDVESFIRKELGLELWDIRKTYWKYNQSDYQSSPVKGRLVFGDALFFRPLSGIDDWLSGFSGTEKASKLIMLIISAINYGYPDYAEALLSLPIALKIVPPEKYETIKSVIQRSMTGFRPFRFGNGRLHMIFDAMAKAVQPTHNGWASTERHLGSRRWKNFWI